MRSLAAALLLLTGLALLPAGARAQTFLTQEEALRLAFPEPAEVERRTAFLEEDELERARELAGSGVEIDQRVVTYYEGIRADSLLGLAYFDSHRVRTLPEVVMFVLEPDGTIRRIEVLKFTEPPEYAAPDRWLDQFPGLGLSDALSLKGEIVNLTGATLTARAVTRAARKVTALHRVIHGETAGDAGGEDAGRPSGREGGGGAGPDDGG